MQPYNMNPYYFQNPYQQQYNPLQPQMDRLAQMQAPYNQQPMYNQMNQTNPPTGLSGEIVDGLEVVRAKNVDLSGAVTYYPKADLSEIYTKQLMPDGTSRITTYKAVRPEEEKATVQQPYVDIQTLNSMLGQMKAEILQGIGGELSEIKQMITPSELPKPQRGGSQKRCQ